MSFIALAAAGACMLPAAFGNLDSFDRSQYAWAAIICLIAAALTTIY